MAAHAPFESRSRPPNWSRKPNFPKVGNKRQATLERARNPLSIPPEAALVAPTVSIPEAGQIRRFLHQPNTFTLNFFILLKILTASQFD
jgi:hypothetical protein